VIDCGYNMSNYSHQVLASGHGRIRASAYSETQENPQQARSADTVAALLEAAARILETRGFDGYTTNYVAARAGVSIGSVYQYFPNKDALTLALIERETALLLEELAAIATDSTYEAGIGQLIRAAIRHQLRRPELARLLDFEEQRLPATRRDQQVTAVITNLVIALLRLPSAPRVSNPQLAAADVLAMVRGIVDGAGQRGETNATNLQRRVECAVRGYLASVA